MAKKLTGRFNPRDPLSGADTEEPPLAESVEAGPGQPPPTIVAEAAPVAPERRFTKTIIGGAIGERGEVEAELRASTTGAEVAAGVNAAAGLRPLLPGLYSLKLTGQSAGATLSRGSTFQRAGLRRGGLGLSLATTMGPRSRLRDRSHALLTGRPLRLGGGSA